MSEASDKARVIFKRTYGNQRNFMTPDLIEYGMINANTAYELSSGTGMSNDTIYGVTILEQHWGKPTVKRTDLSKMCETEVIARRYINQLQKEA